MRGADLETALTAGELLSYREGSTGTVAVRRLTGTFSLAIDGKVDASNAGDMLTQRLLAHVPLLLHPNPQRVAILGLGSGVTLGLGAHPSASAKRTVLEISPEVVERIAVLRRRESSRARRPADAPGRRRRPHALDARPRTYDVIVSEPSNPWMAGIASLFTREFFEGARARLAPGGVLCQWAHTYDISNARPAVDRRDVPVGVPGRHPVAGRRRGRAAGRIDRSRSTPASASMAAAMAAARAWPRISLAPAVAEPVFGARRSSSRRESPEAWVERRAAADRRSSGARVLRPAQHLRRRARRQRRGPARRSPPGRPSRSRSQEAPAASPPAWNGGIADLMLLKADAIQPAYDDLARALESIPTTPRARRTDPGRRVRLNQTVRSAGNPDATGSRPGKQRGEAGALAGAGIPGQRSRRRSRIPLDLLQADPGDVPALEQLASILSDVGDAGRLEPVGGSDEGSRRRTPGRTITRLRCSSFNRAGRHAREARLR